MDDFFAYLLLIIVIVALVTLGYSVVHDLNLSGTAIATYTGDYCHPSGCDYGQETDSGYIYPDEPFTCPESISVFKYFMMVGKNLIPQYDSYYFQEGSCKVTSL